MDDESWFAEIRLPEQKSDGGHLFPSVVGPGPAIGSDLSRLTEAIKEKKAWLDELLKESGAVLMRGFGVETASDFNSVVEAFGYEEMAYTGGTASRSRVVGRVYTANEAPPHQIISFPHEMSYSTKFPYKLFFFCEEEPKRGGETPIVLSHLIYQRMKERFPEFVEKLEEHGVIYTRVIGDEYDPSTPIGSSWKQAFSTDDKCTAEKRAADIGMKLEWIEGGVKRISGPMPAIRMDKLRGHKVWFNSIVLSWSLGEAVAYGDGMVLPSEIVSECQKLMEEECVTLPWRKRDILLIDNFAVLHSRQSFDPPRRVLASLCK